MAKMVPVLLTGMLMGVGMGCEGKMMTRQISMPDIKLEASPPEKVQEQIATVLKADSNEAFLREAANLLELSRELKWDQRRLLQEVVDYAPKVQGQQQMTRFDRLADVLDIPRGNLVEVAAATLDSKSSAIEQQSKTLLRLAAPSDPLGPADFSAFASYLQTHRNPLPEKLILWMYDRDPNAALMQMMAVEGNELSSADQRAILVGQRVIDQLAWKQHSGLANVNEVDPLAVEQLEAMSRQKPWWVRLYVAEILARYPALRKADVVKRLASDEHPLVRQAAKPLGA